MTVPAEIESLVVVSKSERGLMTIGRPIKDIQKNRLKACHRIHDKHPSSRFEIVATNISSKPITLHKKKVRAIGSDSPESIVDTRLLHGKPSTSRQFFMAVQFPEEEN